MECSGFIVLVFDHEYVVLLNESGSGMLDLGCSLANQFDKLINNQRHTLRTLKNLLDDVRIITKKNSRPSNEDINNLKKYANPKNLLNKMMTWEKLLKQCEGSIKNILKSGHMIAEFVCHNRSALEEYFKEGFAHNEIEEGQPIYELNFDTNIFQCGKFSCKLTEVTESKIRKWLENQSDSSESEPKCKKGKKGSKKLSSSDSEEYASKKDKRSTKSDSESGETKPNKKPLKKISKPKDTESDTDTDSETNTDSTESKPVKKIIRDESGSSSDSEEKVSNKKLSEQSTENAYQLFVRERDSDLMSMYPRMTERARMEEHARDWKNLMNKSTRKAPQSDESDSASDSEEKISNKKLSESESDKNEKPSEYKLFMQKRRLELAKKYPKADSHAIIMMASKEWRQRDKTSVPAPTQPTLTPDQKKHLQRVERLNKSKAFIVYNAFIESKLKELGQSKPGCSPVELYALAGVAWRNSI